MVWEPLQKLFLQGMLKQFLSLRKETLRKSNHLKSVPFQLRHAKLESAYKWKSPHESRSSSGPLSVSANYRSAEVDPARRMRARKVEGHREAGTSVMTSVTQDCGHGYGIECVRLGPPRLALPEM
ncbi:hypothetical protein PoB_002557100 [Plakobranchus ocellatus]|uniref:Uncharacterized protein n=1 Tax=Plakobranchus ocellatus TaxID=259542 RepID=A0AAV3ZIX7_9GAST|nr:hypothetical protein PoB_002557100 [Plakobranchus ocellatus]